MNSNVVFGIESATSLLFFALVARWYWWPHLAKLPQRDALTPLLLLHVTRTIGLTTLVPTIVTRDLPQSFATPEAYGDLLAAVLALVAIIALRARLPFATLLVWVFSIEGIADLGNAIAQGLRINLPGQQLGVVWLIFTVLVPALLVTHLMIVARLVRPRQEPATVR